MRLDASNKPYEALGIGDVVSLGMVSGHTFVFAAVEPVVPDTHLEQQWLSRGLVRVDHTTLCVVDGCADFELRVHSGHGYASATIRLSAKECTDLATQLLSAAMLLEAARVAQPKRTADAFVSMGVSA